MTAVPGAPVLAVVGRPNVGKSTLVNRIIGRREAVVQDVPGVTRDRVSYDANWNGRAFTVVDTGGRDPDARGLAESIRAQAEIAVSVADAVLSAGGEVPIALLLDLTLPVSIELGRTSMTVQEVLRLGRGSVIQLDRLAGEPIDIYIGDRRFAEGEVVVLGEHFGIRITRILSKKAIAEAAA